MCVCVCVRVLYVPRQSLISSCWRDVPWGGPWTHVSDCKGIGKAGTGTWPELFLVFLTLSSPLKNAGPLQVLYERIKLSFHLLHKGVSPAYLPSLPFPSLPRWIFETHILRRIGASVRLFVKPLVEVTGIFMNRFVMLVIVLHNFCTTNHPWKLG